MMSPLVILGILSHPLRWFKEKTVFVRTWFKGIRQNQVETDSSVLKKSGIRFQGTGNRICLRKADLFNTTVFIRGKGHTLIVDEHVKVYNMHIKIIGNNNTVHIGAGTSFGGGQIICGGNGISITTGKNCVFAEGVDIWSTDTHSVTQDGQLVNVPKSICIGDHVWAGKDVAILKGVTIGDGAVIGMRSLVTHDLVEKTLSLGSPARTIRENIDWCLNNPNNTLG
ncbi:MAG: acyltransferase [Bacteroidales bacterium]|nr:acyltransferase [Bacteroidales bacterium]